MSRAEQKAATRERIIKAAQIAFTGHGYEAVNMRDIAQAANISTGAIYGQFADKAAMFEAAMARPAPDPVKFLERVQRELVGRGVPFDALADDAGRLRCDLIGGNYSR